MIYLGNSYIKICNDFYIRMLFFSEKNIQKKLNKKTLFSKTVVSGLFF